MRYLGHKEGFFLFYVGLLVLGLVTIITYRKDPPAMLTGKVIFAIGAAALLLPPLYRIVRDQLREHMPPLKTAHRVASPGEIPAKQTLTDGTQSDAIERAAADRIIITWTPEELWEQFVGRTDFEAQQLVKRFIGTWMVVSGEIEDIMESSENRILVSLHDRPTYRSQYLFFTNRLAIDRIITMRRGDNIKALGQITEISTRTISFRECEIA